MTIMAVSDVGAHRHDCWLPVLVKSRTTPGGAAGNCCLNGLRKAIEWGKSNFNS